MTEGDIVLYCLPQFAGGPPKLRPVLLLASLPGSYQNWLICGISTDLHQYQPNWDELITLADTDYSVSGLHHPSIITLSYLASVDQSEFMGVLGNIEPARLVRLLTRLSDHLRP